MFFLFHLHKLQKDFQKIDLIKFDLKYLTQNMGNGISESTFIKSLMDINPCIDELEYEYTQQGFRGEIDVYKVHIK